jgi:hypothetical protein
MPYEFVRNSKKRIEPVSGNPAFEFYITAKVMHTCVEFFKKINTNLICLDTKLVFKFIYGFGC